ncbi:hypothetical protein SAMN06265379_11626 [Saccharicrinis carchari]|uniref:FG-GAP repeat-containing protein n=1 Tax=Saccharicrinis carchari TaxID=1168039 RepID=A0A521F925_SACCC|nr:hypothetical protein SAMN06265379_11626 [Saccharicrinis carchari]
MSLISLNAIAQTEMVLFNEFTQKFASNIELSEKYIIKNYINPKFLCSDFNGDGEKDIAVLVISKSNNKRGFVVMHGQTKATYVVGAGVVYDSADDWDDMNWVDKWEINTIRVNEPGIQEGDNLRLEYDSIRITKDEIGGGLIYWNGEKYDYFHQTC